VRAIPRELTVESQEMAGGPNPPKHGPMCLTYEVVTTDRIVRAGKSVQPLRRARIGRSARHAPSPRCSRLDVPRPPVSDN
jgi:hypothetical protein